MDTINGTELKLTLDLQRTGFPGVIQLVKSIIETVNNKHGCSLLTISKTIMSMYPDVFIADELESQLKVALKSGVKAGSFVKNGSLYSNYEAFDHERQRNKPKRLQSIENSANSLVTKPEKETRTYKVRGNAVNNVSSDHTSILSNKLTDTDVKDMLENGWQFLFPASPHIGLRIRCFLGLRNHLEGTVDAVLPGCVNRDVALYHVLLDSGARLCLLLDDVNICREFLLSDCTSLTADQYTTALSPLYTDLYTLANGGDSDESSDVPSSSGEEVDCVWQSRVAGHAPFLLRRFSNARSASDSLGVPLSQVLRCCRTGAWQARGASDTVQFNRRVSFRFKKSGFVSSPLRMVSEAVVRALLTTAFPAAAPTQSHNLGSNVRVACLAGDGVTLLREFDDLWHAARELQLPVAGLITSLSRCEADGSQLASFAGLSWRFAVVPSGGPQVPADVLRAMILLQQTGWTAPVEHDTLLSSRLPPQEATVDLTSSVSVDEEVEVERETALNADCVTMASSAVSVTDDLEPSGPTSSEKAHRERRGEERIACLSLDRVKMFDFPSVSAACKAMGFRSEVFVRLCCKGVLQHYCGFRWSICGDDDSPSGSTEGLSHSGSTDSHRVDESTTKHVESSSDAMDVVGDEKTVTEQSGVEVCKEEERGVVRDAPPSGGESKVPISVKDLRLLANVRLHDFNPHLTLAVPETNDASSNGDDDEDDEDDQQPSAEETARRMDSMRDEGWLFGPADNEYIGLRVRRFFPDDVVSDARIEAFLPASLNEGEPQWHLRHDDGDREDVELVPMLKYIEFLRLNLQSEDSFKPREASIAAQSTFSSVSPRFAASSTTALTGTEIHDRNTEKLRIIATERRVVDDETIEDVLQRQYREDCASSETSEVPAVSSLCSLIITIIKGFGDVGANTNELTAHISRYIRPPRTATFERSLRHMLNQLVRINILHKEDNNQPMNERKFFIATKYTNASNVLDLAGSLERDTFSLETAAIDCLAVGSEFLLRFANIHDASATLGIEVSQIKKVCFGKRKTTKNLRFCVATPNADRPLLTSAARQPHVDRALALMSRGAVDGVYEEEDDSDEDSSGSGYYVGARKRPLGALKKKNMTKDDYPPTKQQVSRDCQAELPDIAVVEASSKVAARRPKVPPAVRRVSPVEASRLSSDDELPYWREESPAHTSESRRLFRFHRFEQQRQQALREAEEEATLSSGGDPLSRCVTLPDLVCGDYLFRRKRDPALYDEQYRSYLQQARCRQIRQGAIVAVALRDRGDDARRVKYVCVLRDFCEEEVKLPNTSPKETVAESTVSVGMEVEASLETEKNNQETEHILPSESLDPAPIALSNSKPVEVFDGRLILSVPAADLLLSQEDVLLAFLVQHGGDVAQALTAVERDARNRLETQWNAREVAQYVEGVKTHKTDAPLIFRRTGLNATRSVKAVIDFHYKFYFLNSTQRQDKALALGREELMNVFRCADLLMEAAEKYVLRSPADVEQLRADLERLGLFAALETLSAEIDEVLSRKVANVDSESAAGPQSDLVAGALSTGKRGRPSLSTANGTYLTTSSSGTAGIKKTSSKSAGSSESGVVMVDVDTNQDLRIYPSVRYVAETLGCQPSEVVSCMQGRSAECRGFRWKAYDGPRINFAQFPHGLELASAETSQLGFKRKLGSGSSLNPQSGDAGADRARSIQKKPYPHVILEAVCNPPQQLEGATVSEIVQLVAALHPGVNYKPAHIQSSAEKMVGTGVLERFLSGDRVRITPTGQTVLAKLQEMTAPPRLTTQQIHDLVQSSDLVASVAALVKSQGSNKSHSARSLRNVLQRTSSLPDSLKGLDPAQLMDVVGGALLLAESQGLIGRGEIAGEYAALSAGEIEASGDSVVKENASQFGEPFSGASSPPKRPRVVASEEVDCFNASNGKFLRRFPNLLTASQQLDLSLTRLTACCSDHTDTGSVSGLYFRTVQPCHLSPSQRGLEEVPIEDIARHHMKVNNASDGTRSSPPSSRAEQLSFCSLSSLSSNHQPQRASSSAHSPSPTVRPAALDPSAAVEVIDLSLDTQDSQPLWSEKQPVVAVAAVTEKHFSANGHIEVISLLTSSSSSSSQDLSAGEQDVSLPSECV